MTAALLQMETSSKQKVESYLYLLSTSSLHKSTKFINILHIFVQNSTTCLTATPFRKYNDGKIIFFHLGEIIDEIKTTEISSYKQAKIIIRNTGLDIPFNSKTDQFETLPKILVHDSTRNKLILKDVYIELKLGKKVFIITERKEHIDTLNQYLKQSYETLTLSGKHSLISSQKISVEFFMITQIHRKDL